MPAFQVSYLGWGGIWLRRRKSNGKGRREMTNVKEALHREGSWIR